MKNNKKSPLTKARQAAFIEDMGGNYPTLADVHTAEFNAVVTEFIGIDTDAQKQSRIAMESTAQGYRENSPELYGRKVNYEHSMGGYVMHGAGASADPELTEIERGIVGASGHNQELSVVGSNVEEA